MDERGHVPPDLPALWAALGKTAQAESLARFLANHHAAWSMARLARAIAARGDIDRAERLVRATRLVHDAYETAHAWTELAWVAATAGDSRVHRLLHEAYAAAGSLDEPLQQASLLLEWARVRAAGGDRGAAGKLVDRACVRAADGPPRWVVDALPVMVTGHGDLDRAEALAKGASDPSGQVTAALAAILSGVGEHQRAEALLEGVAGDRRPWLRAAVATTRGFRPQAGVDPHRRARALTSLARWAAAEPSDQDPGDWSAVVAHHIEPDDRVRVFTALTHGATVTASVCEEVVGLVPFAARPAVAVALAWLVADAGEPARAATLAAAALGFTSEAVEHLVSLRKSVLLPGKRADEWEPLMPADGVPAMKGTPRNTALANQLRNNLIRERWPWGLPVAVATALTDLDDATWWVDHQETIAPAVAEFAAVTRWSGPPELTGSPAQRKWAMRLRGDLTYFYWSSHKPLAVRVALNQLTDAAWWIRNHKDDDHQQTLAIAFSKHLPRLERNRMGVWRPPPEPGYSHEHEGPCKSRPDYDESYEVFFAATAEHGDIRVLDKLPSDCYSWSCCGAAGREAGEKDGEKAYLEKQTKSLQHTRSLPKSAALKQARADLAYLQRMLNGSG